MRRRRRLRGVTLALFPLCPWSIRGPGVRARRSFALRPSLPLACKSTTQCTPPCVAEAVVLDGCSPCCVSAGMPAPDCGLRMGTQLALCTAAHSPSLAVPTPRFVCSHSAMLSGNAFPRQLDWEHTKTTQTHTLEQRGSIMAQCASTQYWSRHGGLGVSVQVQTPTPAA